MNSADPTLVAVAEQVAVRAAELVAAAQERLRGGMGMAVGTKSSDTDVVTAADHDSERLIRDQLATLRPGDSVLGEEEGRDGAADTGSVTWVVDPIDGTVNFLYGYPLFAVSVAAQVDGESVAGAVVEPLTGRRWTALRGGGARLNGMPLRPPGRAATRLDLALVATGFSYDAERRRRQADLVRSLLGRVRDIRRGGSAALDLCAAAAGWVDGFYEHGLSRWDWAAGTLIAREAGADVVLPGEDAALGADALFAAAPSIAPALRDALAESGAASV